MDRTNTPVASPPTSFLLADEVMEVMDFVSSSSGEEESAGGNGGEASLSSRQSEEGVPPHAAVAFQTVEVEEDVRMRDAKEGDMKPDLDPSFRRVVDMDKLAWADVAVGIQELRVALSQLYDPAKNMKFSYFSRLFLSNQLVSVRRKVLIKVMRKAYNEASFWDRKTATPDEEEEEHEGSVTTACRQWGIEWDPKVIWGDTDSETNTRFWSRVVARTKWLIKMPDRAKIMLATKLPEDQERISWKDMVEWVMEKAFQQENNVTLKGVVSMDVLFKNGFPGLEPLVKLVEGIRQMLSSSEFKDHAENECILEQGHGLCVSIKSKADNFSQSVEELVDFIKENNGFEKDKLAFMVFYADYAADCVKKVLAIHGTLLLDLGELWKPLDIDDDLGWL